MKKGLSKYNRKALFFSGHDVDDDDDEYVQNEYEVNGVEKHGTQKLYFASQFQKINVLRKIPPSIKHTLGVCVEIVNT